MPQVLNNESKKNTLRGLLQLAGRIVHLEPGESAFGNERPCETEFLGYESFSRLNAELMKEVAPVKVVAKKAIGVR